MTSHHYQDSEGRRVVQFPDAGREQWELRERGELLRLEHQSALPVLTLLLDADSARAMAQWLYYWAETGCLPAVSEEQDRAMVAAQLAGTEEWLARAEAVLGRESEESNGG